MCVSNDVQFLEKARKYKVAAISGWNLPSLPVEIRKEYLQQVQQFDETQSLPPSRSTSYCSAQKSEEGIFNTPVHLQQSKQEQKVPIQKEAVEATIGEKQTNKQQLSVVEDDGNEEGWSDSDDDDNQRKLKQQDKKVVESGVTSQNVTKQEEEKVDGESSSGWDSDSD
eukprot:TRINITY_DN66252_c0_g1_i8.p5 TRINITY_DN66252_c0_g1~~TRINITY_DN66252_c0_g1_i8.p5  ORF type:complete len:168 (+),score=39.57 TRINITY_DN66252_c0_g1_i8:421-924(+)